MSANREGYSTASKGCQRLIVCGSEAQGLHAGERAEAGRFRRRQAAADAAGERDLAHVEDPARIHPDVMGCEEAVWGERVLSSAPAGEQVAARGEDAQPAGR